MDKRKPCLIIIATLLWWGTCLAQGGGTGSFTLTSAAFQQGGEIPRLYTCDGSDSTPPLSWSGLPKGTQSLVLIVDDPDAPQTTWVHWVLYNIPPTVTQLPPGVSAATLPAGIKEGLNDWQRTDYGGPCPPSGRHRYVHKLYALDKMLDLKKPTKAALEAAMAGHILAKTELVGTYQRAR
jgi:hypothetical protein